MRLTISSISGGNPQVLQLDVPSSICIQDLKALISSELPQMPSASQHIYYNGRLLSDATRTLEAYNMKDDDMVVVHTIAPRPQAQARPQQQQQHQQQQQMQMQSQPQQQEYDPEVIRLQLLANAQLQAQLRETNPELVEAMNDPAAFRDAFGRMERDRREKEREKQREITRSTSRHSRRSRNSYGKSRLWRIFSPRSSTTQKLLAVLRCSTSPSKSTAPPSKHSSTAVRKQPSCHPTVRNGAESCGWWTPASPASLGAWAQHGFSAACTARRSRSATCFSPVPSR
ncbi:hypothetical protein BZA05DRAFT_88593 [Tricharina praecox]|uniref:uncharacterized protein n=1 Tax=Tricharina praecox TaxID=43433 RepID=UPI00222041BA|nr:uncharacterized protein BZA05DRAFT_88593 [Tricharina praecox]KAI5848844.1 hypothetical protein BZA05DRAFT_88593 [Tricharina praecox]